MMTHEATDSDAMNSSKTATTSKASDDAVNENKYKMFAMRKRFAKMQSVFYQFHLALTSKNHLPLPFFLS